MTYATLTITFRVLARHVSDSQGLCHRQCEYQRHNHNQITHEFHNYATFGVVGAVDFL